MERGLKIRHTLQPVGKFLQRFCHGCVEHDVGTGDRIGGAHHTELEFVASEGKGGGPVAVRSVPGEFRQHMNAQLQNGFLGAAVRGVRLNGIQNSGKLVAQKDRDYSRRCFVGAQTVIVAGSGHRQPQQVLIIVHGLNGGAQEQQELGIFVGRLTGFEQIHAGVRSQRPVVVLAAAVDASKGLLRQQAHQIVAGGDSLHDLHNQLVLVGSHIGYCINRSQFVLGGSYLVMFRLRIDTQFPQFCVQFLHIGFYPGFDSAEVVIIQFLPLGRLCTEQSPTAEDQILPLFIHGLVDQKILLLRAYAGMDALDVLIAEELQDPKGLLVQRLHGSQQRCFLIQGLATVGTERRGDAQGMSLNEGIGSGVPGSIAAGLKSGPQTAGREGGSVRLSLNQLLAGKFHDDAAVGRRGNEAFVFFCGNASQRLEPVGEMGSAVLHSPVPHGGSYRVCHMGVQRSTLINGPLQRSINIGGQLGPHDPVIKYQTAEIVRNCTHV